jgi:hypothetical protein
MDPNINSSKNLWKIVFLLYSSCQDKNKPEFPYFLEKTLSLSVNCWRGGALIEGNLQIGCCPGSLERTLKNFG